MSSPMEQLPLVSIRMLAAFKEISIAISCLSSAIWEDTKSIEPDLFSNLARSNWEIPFVTLFLLIHCLNLNHQTDEFLSDSCVFIVSLYIRVPI